MPGIDATTRNRLFILLVRLLDDLLEERDHINRGKLMVSPQPFHYHRAGRDAIEAALDQNSETWAELADLMEANFADQLDDLDFDVEMVFLAFDIYDMRLYGARRKEDYAVSEVQEDVVWRTIDWRTPSPASSRPRIVGPRGEEEPEDESEDMRIVRDFYLTDFPVWTCCCPS
ncbi:hypothetical protein PRZ48_008331 [Zasmidium cellare]|uniref:Uncharacterized protein n=1 Tax=Zasmidium cellare TaxID=395010 RepID=A0ABR0EG76_ZASCE|nr:hypothetical protein PRZ48_008331 [Zasmidium cellare]